MKRRNTGGQVIHIPEQNSVFHHLKTDVRWFPNRSSSAFQKPERCKTASVRAVEGQADPFFGFLLSVSDLEFNLGADSAHAVAADLGTHRGQNYLP